MSTNKIDLNKLKNEIEQKRSERVVQNQNNSGIQPRDSFLHSLTESLNKGVPTQATETVKQVVNEAAIKKNERPVHSVSNTRPQQAPQPKRPVNNQRIDEGYDREEQMYQDINNMNQNGNYLNHNGQQYLAAPPQQYQQQPQQINEALLTETVATLVNNHISDNLTNVLGEAVNNTVANLYAAERIKTVLNENREIIEQIIYDTLRKLQDKSKKK